MPNKIEQDWYLGIDIGTNSVGFAATDEKYNLLRYKGKDIWGSYLFEEGKTAKGRRLFRSQRRRLERRKARQSLLRDFFRDEIEKVDKEFYLRLDESKFYEEDKKVSSKNSIFHDEHFNDRDYFKKFPTIFHLRKYLIESKKQEDIRFYFLALNDLMKNRGHFLFEGQKFTGLKDPQDFKNSLKVSIEEHADIFENLDETIDESLFEQLFSIVLEEKTLKDKKKEIKQALKDVTEFDTKKVEEIFFAILTSEIKVTRIWPSIEDEEMSEKINLDVLFGDGDKGSVENLLQERINLLETIKAVKDAIQLSKILQHDFLSFDQVERYEKHQQELKDIKKIFHLDDSIYTSTFKKYLDKNYVCYIGKNKGKRCHESKCNQEAVNKFILGKLETILTEKTELLTEKQLYEKALELKEKASENKLLPKQLSAANGIIPYQVHELELVAILKKLEQYYPSFKEVKDGMNTIDKIHKTFTFKIPYFVGPLNDYHADKDGFAWLVKKMKNEKITPWNWREVIDLDQTEEKFISRLINTCTYLYGEPVLPKNSILYNRFQVLNELNQVLINGVRLPVNIKKEVYHHLFRRHDKVTKKKLRDFLIQQNYTDSKELEITGLAQDFESSLRVENKIKAILKEKYSDELAEKIIKISTISSENHSRYEANLRKLDKSFTEEEMKALLSLKCKDWGKLSAKLLNELEGVEEKTGEVNTILGFLENSQDNLMQLLSSKYTFAKSIEKLQKEERSSEKLNKEFIRSLNIDPAARKSMSSVLDVLRDLRRIFANQPKKIFIEFARGKDNSKEKDSRYQKIQKLYSTVSKDAEFFDQELVEHLNRFSKDDLKRERLYLYFMQCGRCLYTGKKLNLESVLNGEEYDRDHIIPQSMKKDDSIINNLVLTTKDFNNNVKKDQYPLPDQARKQAPLWRFLKEHKFISEEKYNRLMRQEPLSVEELTAFIEKQLVETRQSTKYIAELLNYHYKNSEIVYVKAGLVSGFRQEFGIFKCRYINDTHHAQDAYLNIVVGNCYSEKFTKNIRRYIQERKESNRVNYSLKVSTVFGKDIKDKKVWDKDIDVARVKNIALKNSMLIVRKTFDKKGELFNASHVPASAVKKGTAYLPLKKESRLAQLEKYGAYSSLKVSYFLFVKYQKGKKMQYKFLSIPVFLKEKEVMGFVEKELDSPQFTIIRKIPINSVIEWDGFRYAISGKSLDTLLLKPMEIIHFRNDDIFFIKQLYKLKQRLSDKKDKVDIRVNFDIKKIDSLFINLNEKIQNSKLKKRFGMPDIEQKQLERFVELDINNKLVILFNLIDLFCFKGSGLSFKEISAKDTPTIRISSNIKNSLRLILQSPTGIFEEVVELI